MGTTSGDSLEWFGELEKKITVVAGELADLRKKNRSLLAKAQRLERQTRDDSSAAEAEWEGVRKKVRTQVERLTQDLEALLRG